MDEDIETQEDGIGKNNSHNIAVSDVLSTVNCMSQLTMWYGFYLLLRPYGYIKCNVIWSILDSFIVN